MFALRDGLTTWCRRLWSAPSWPTRCWCSGSAFVAGGLRHGVQHFDPEEPRLNASLLCWWWPPCSSRPWPTASAPRLPPTFGALGCLRHRPAGRLRRQRPLLPAAAGYPQATPEAPEPRDATRRTGSAPTWPLWLSVTLLAVGSLGAALASDWFVGPLKPATEQLGLSQTFTGLVVVAIASNAVEHAVGIRFAVKAKPEYAISTTLNSPLQVALLLTPVLVLLSRVVGPTQLNLVFPPLLVAALAVSALVVAVIIYDGEYTWIEGVALIALYCIIAAAFWWG